MTTTPAWSPIRRPRTGACWARHSPPWGSSTARPGGGTGLTATPTGRSPRRLRTPGTARYRRIRGPGSSQFPWLARGHVGHQDTVPAGFLGGVQLPVGARDEIVGAFPAVPGGDAGG